MVGPDHNTLVLRIARERLGSLGLRQKGRSRTWLDDHGWWLIVVEFQPSSGSKGTYCNVGFDHLWFERDHLVLDQFERLPAAGGQFIPFNPEAPHLFEAESASMADSVTQVIEERRLAHGSSDAEALKRLALRSGDLYADYDAGAAAGLLGWRQEAEAAFDRVHSAEEHAPWVVGVKDQAASLAGLLDSPPALAGELTRRVNQTRAAVGLDPTQPSWNPHIETDRAP